jgi:hypothetical protein
MPIWLIIGLFVALLASLVVIIWWEFLRARGAPRSVSKAFNRHLATQGIVPPARVRKEVKRGFDAWD